MADSRRARSPPPMPNPMTRYTDMSPVSPFFPSTYSPPSPPLYFPPSKPSVLAVLRARRSLLCTLAAAVVVIVLISNSAAYYTGHSLYPASLHGFDETSIAVTTSQKPPIDRLAALRGAPTMKFRDNLRADTKYIHSWLSAGWTNDVMTFANLIYLGLITDRVPIVHVFNNVHNAAPPIPFNWVFDIDRLSTDLQLPVIEWDEVKNSTSTELEELGCWNVWEAVQYREHHPREAWGQTSQKQKLDLSWTQAPETIKIIPGYEHDQWARIWDLATLTFDSGREKSLAGSEPKITESPINHHKSLPDDHMACFDYLYYTSATVSEEFWHTYSPVWRDVARHMHWNPDLQTLADKHLRRMFNLGASDAIPPFIGIHIRHGDFYDYCKYADVSREACFPSMAEYSAEVQRIRKTLEEKKGISPQHVVVLSDEKDAAWWAEIRAQGWFTPTYDDEQAIEKYGKVWYTVFHDAVILSSGVGLLGTPDSTYSLLAGRRVIDWQGGVYRDIKWEARGKGGRDMPLP
ncbi:unnamed protein product [Peniophora sp. CBMAI 1063]|nr:unnamed protein product [Peniophora sp. CBMAI 1063]